MESLPMVLLEWSFVADWGEAYERQDVQADRGIETRRTEKVNGTTKKADDAPHSYAASSVFWVPCILKNIENILLS